MALTQTASWAADPVPNPAAGTCPPVAQALAPEQVHAGMRNARDRGFLWRIGKDGRHSYLFGTIHVARLEWMFPGPTVVRALNASDLLALEVDMLDPGIRGRMSQLMAASPSEPVPAPLKERLSRQIAAACLAPAALESMRPAMQLATLSILASRRDGLDPSYGIDLFLAGYGRGSKKTVVSLETPELQMQAIETPNPSDAIEVLAQGLEDLEHDRVRPKMSRIAQIWADSDHAELSRYEAWCDCAKTESDRRAMKRMLDDRNPALADKIAELHAGGKNVFAAVGSLHMFGALGLPELMARRGFSVEAIEFGSPTAGAEKKSVRSVPDER